MGLIGLGGCGQERRLINTGVGHGSVVIVSYGSVVAGHGLGRGGSHGETGQNSWEGGISCDEKGEERWSLSSALGGSYGETPPVGRERCCDENREEMVVVAGLGGSDDETGRARDGLWQRVEL